MYTKGGCSAHSTDVKRGGTLENRTGRKWPKIRTRQYYPTGSFGTAEPRNSHFGDTKPGWGAAWQTQRKRRRRHVARGVPTRKRGKTDSQ